VGLKKPVFGGIAGLIFTLIYCFFSAGNEVNVWIVLPILGLILGFSFPISIRWLFSGYKGARGKSKPGVTYIGGFHRTGQYFGKWSPGIIPAKDEETEWIYNKDLRRERTISIIIRYCSAPLILLAAILAFHFLHLG
jgi:hypothetical protein